MRSIKPDFTTWKAQVDRAIAAKMEGIDSEGLPDFNYVDMWREGITPSKAAARAIRAAF